MSTKIEILISSEMRFDADNNPVTLDPQGVIYIEYNQHVKFINNCVECGYQDELQTDEDGNYIYIRMWFDTLVQFIEWFIGATH